MTRFVPVNEGPVTRPNDALCQSKTARLFLMA